MESHIEQPASPKSADATRVGAESSCRRRKVVDDNVRLPSAKGSTGAPVPQPSVSILPETVRKAPAGCRSDSSVLAGITPVCAQVSMKPGGAGLILDLEGRCVRVVRRAKEVVDLRLEVDGLPAMVSTAIWAAAPPPPKALAAAPPPNDDAHLKGG